MAKKKRKKGRKGRRFGSTIVVRKLRGVGVGALNQPTSWLGSFGPALIGAVVTEATHLGIREMMTPGASTMQDAIIQYAPWVGLAAGGVTALALAGMVGQPAAVGAAAGAAIVTGVHAVRDMTQGLGRVHRMSRRGPLGDIVLEPAADRGYGTPPNVRAMNGARTGAVVAEYGMRGVGSYGAQVSVQQPSALGALSISSKFGTPAF
jgi:hypothetical protein